MGKTNTMSNETCRQYFSQTIYDKNSAGNLLIYYVHNAYSCRELQLDNLQKNITYLVVKNEKKTAQSEKSISPSCRCNKNCGPAGVDTGAAYDRDQRIIADQVKEGMDTNFIYSSDFTFVEIFDLYAIL